MNKIAIVIFSDGFGGAEKVVWQTINYLKSQIDIYLIINNEIISYYSELLEERKILNVGYAFDYREKPVLGKLIENRFWQCQFLWNSRFNKSIRRFIQENDIRLIHVHLDIPLFYIYNLVKKFTKKGEIRLLFTVHDAIPFSKETKSFVNNNKKRRLLKIISKIDGVIFVSKYVYSIYQKYIGNNLQYKIIYNAVDIDYIRTFIKPLENKKYFSFLYVGGERYNKGYDILLRVFKNLIHNHLIRNISLTILGSIPDKGSIRRLIKSYRIEDYVILDGYRKQPENFVYMNKCDALLMPSRSEALGIAAIEALAMNKFVIASKIGGIPELINNNVNGFLFKLDNNDFEDKIIKFINNYDQISSNQKSNELISRYNIETFTKELTQFYNIFFQVNAFIKKVNT
jgi:glycosyltransferase involved in cell wall biosynthesis